MSIQQKVTLTLFEAREKALEIEVITNEEFAYEKEKRVHQDIDAIEAYFNEKEKQVLIDKKILHSNSVKDARLEALKLKETFLLQIRDAALKEAHTVVNDKPRYENFLYGAILQSLEILMDAEVFVYCKKEDVSYIKSAIPNITKEFNESQEELETKITLIEEEEHYLTCVGGVFVTSLHDKIKKWFLN
eukprot:gene6629-10795_t